MLPTYLKFDLGFIQHGTFFKAQSNIRALLGLLLTQNSADLIGKHRVCVVQPASPSEALFKPAQDGLVTQQHHQDHESCRHCAGVNMLFHKHQQPIKTQGAHKLFACPVGGSRENISEQKYLEAYDK